MPEISNVQPVGEVDERALLDRVDDKVEDKKEEVDDDDADNTDSDSSDPSDLDGSDVDDSDNEKEKEDEGEESNEDEDDQEDVNDSLYQKVKKHDPKLLKQIPELRSVIFREQKFTELFPSVEEAEKSKEVAEIFQTFEADILAGNSGNILNALQESGKKNFENFCANFIETVKEKDETTYLNILYPEFKKMLRFYSKHKDENISTSANNIHFAIFGDTKLEEEVGLKASKKDPKEEELSKKEREFEERQFNSFATDVSSVASKRAKSIIRQGFADSGFSEFMQTKMIDEIFDRTNTEVTKDVRHMGNMNNLWLQAKKAGYTSDKKDSLINAFLSRAKLLIPRYRQQVIAEAKGSGKQVSNDKKRTATRIDPTSKSVHQSQGKINTKDVDYSKVDERALLDGGKIPLRK